MLWDGLCVLIVQNMAEAINFVHKFSVAVTYLLDV
jgi:hypothetical protein